MTTCTSLDRSPKRPGPPGRPLAINADALVTILFPEETFLPRCLRGVATQITEQGMEWTTYQLTERQVAQIQHEKHFAKVSLELPLSTPNFHLRAEVLSVTYRVRTRTEPARATLGLHFTGDLKPQTAERLHRALDRIRGASIRMKPTSQTRLKKEQERDR